MSVDLPEMEPGEFARRLAELSPLPLGKEAIERLWVHYRELARWNRRLSLIGPGTADDVLRRHYGESLAGLVLLRESDATLVDVGSGGGFPGLVLAAARPDLEVFLVESRQKKWAFLELVAEKAGLPCRCLNARVTNALPSALPEKMDVVATRAVKLPRASIEALSSRLSASGRFLLWTGAEPGDAASRWLPGRSIELAGATRRRILELHPPGRETP